MKNVYKLIIPVLVFALLVTACSEEIKPVSDNFVVEGFIVANQPINDIKLKGLSPIDADAAENTPITTATVNIQKDGESYPLTYNSGVNRYEYNGTDVSVVTGDVLDISVTVNERTATATTSVPSPPTGLSLTDNRIVVPPIPLSFQTRSIIEQLFAEARITLTWDLLEGQSYFVVIESDVSAIDPILPEQVPEEAKELLSSFKFVSEPAEFNSFDIIGVALESYGKYQAKVYTVNNEYTELYNNTEQDSRDLNEPPSNVKNALGIFTAFAVDSLEFEVVRR